jgi:hypothetical protein
MASIAGPYADRSGDDSPEDEGFEMILEISSETRRLLARLAAESGGTEFEVIGKAVALYQVATEARKQGKRIGLLDAEDEFEREIVGF